MVAYWQQEADQEIISISATACDKETRNGSIVECESSKETEAYLDKMLSESRCIDKECPGPTMPGLDHLFEVQRIGNDGTVYLKGEIILELAGLSCQHPDLENYLKALFISPFQHKLSFKESGYQECGRVYAYLWEVDTEFGSNLGDEAIGLGPMVASINETTLTSGWCHPVTQINHNYHKRYLEITKLAK